MAQDTLQRSKERYQDALDEMSETHQRILEDLRFSNPAKPEQWPAEMLQARKARPAYTFDRTNQFIQQVVNDARQNKPSIEVLPADSVADPAVAEQIGGMIRHIEYVSRAGIAYDTAIELSARAGLGWLRVVPQVMRPETNEQEIRILRAHDPLSCMLEAGWTQPDGSDATVGWATTMMPRRAFKARWPKASATADWDDGGGIWTQANADLVRIAEEFEVAESLRNSLEIVLPDGSQQLLAEDEYWTRAQELGFQPRVLRQFEATERSVKWRHLTGAEVLEETDFPSQFLPIIPVLGFELWVDGKRYLCGLTRRLMDGQRLHNYEMTALAEALATQPKAPFVAPAEAIAGHERHWERLNSGNPSYLPYNHVDAENNPVPPPTRLNPPTMPAGFAQSAVLAGQEMEAAVGMYKANLGAQGNERSGRAINARRQEGDTATFHFIDNLARSIEQLGRVAVDMIPRVYDTPRRARILGVNGEQSFVHVDPGLKAPARHDGKAVVAINPGVGAYDVRVKVGPAYSTQRQEAALQLTELVRATPQLMPVLGPMWARLQDFPEADKLAKVLLTMAPPAVQQLEGVEQGGQPQIPPEVQQQMQQAQEHIRQLEQALQQAQAGLDKAQIQAEAQIEVARINATSRQDVEELKGWVQLLIQKMQPPPQLTAQALTEGPHEGPSSFPPPEPVAPGDQVNSDPHQADPGQQFMG
jgi:hypothetical protein